MRTGIKIAVVLCIATLAAIVSAPGSSADSAVTVQDSGNIAWVLICSALVFIMTPGVALFYGGMLRKQSMTSIMAQTALIMGIMTLSWTIVGYSLAFSGDLNGIIGNLD
ncbi:MAG: ammonium transporter, partial [Candidatus Methanomethylophilaceae archaeon]|nr:ammonium transporter [Candidatus Methanomethylophilaceae archaeon]